MAEAERPEEKETDEHGLVAQRYEAMVLVVVPAERFAEETLRHARSSLYNVHVGTWSVSTAHEDLIRGRLQDEFQVDGPLEGATLGEYAGVIFVGGEGALALAEDDTALELARQAAREDKVIGAWGHALAILARAGVVKRRKVTGARSLRADVERAGGRYTGVQVERDRRIVTALDDSAGMRFGRSLAQVVRI